MRRSLITMAVLVIVVGICTSEIWFLDSTIEYFTQEIKSIEDLIDDEKMEDAYQKALDLNQAWTEKYQLISTFIEHQPLQEIDETFFLMTTLLAQEQKEDFFSESSRAINELQHLKDTETPSLSNLL